MRRCVLQAHQRRRADDALAAALGFDEAQRVEVLDVGPELRVSARLGVELLAGGLVGGLHIAGLGVGSTPVEHPCHAHQHERVLFIELAQPLVEDHRVDVRLGGAHVLGIHGVRAALVGRLARLVQQLDRQPSIPILAGQIGHEVHDSSLHCVRVEGQSDALLGDRGQLAGSVGIQLERVRLLEGGLGSLVHQQAHVLLADEDQRDAERVGARLLVEPGQVVDQIRVVALDQHVDLVEDGDQVRTTALELLGQLLEHLRRREAAIGETGIELVDDLKQRRGGRRTAPTVHVHRLEVHIAAVPGTLELPTETLRERRLSRTHGATHEHRLLGALLEDGAHLQGHLPHLVLAVWKLFGNVIER